MYFCQTFDEFSVDSSGFQEIMTNGSSLVLDSERGELVRAQVNSNEQNVTPADKALLALKNHCESERRRRERINNHLTTLRRLIPGAAKMDKAALLAEVISQVKELRENVANTTRGTLIPTDTDELIVEQEPEMNNINSFSIRASLCCDFKHELLSEIRNAIEALPLKTVRAEIATLGSRMVNVFTIVGNNKAGTNIKDGEGCQFLLNSIHKALRLVLDKFYASEEFSARNTVPNKRRRVSLFTSSNASSSEDIW